MTDPRPKSLTAEYEGLPVLRLSGAQIAQAAESDVIPEGFDASPFDIDYDEFDEFVRLRDLAERARPPQAEGLRAIRDAIHERVGDDYPLLGLLVDLEAALRAEATRDEGLDWLDRAVADVKWSDHGEATDETRAFDAGVARLATRLSRERVRLDAEQLGMAMDMVSDEDIRLGVVGRGTYAERVAAQYDALATAPKP